MDGIDSRLNACITELNNKTRCAPAEPEPSGFVSVFIKRIIRRLIRWYTEPIFERQTAFNQAVISSAELLRDSIKALNERIDQVSDLCADTEQRRAELETRILAEHERSRAEYGRRFAELERRIAELGNKTDSRYEKTRIIARDAIRAKWKLNDYIASQSDTRDRIIKCHICGFTAEVKDFETVTSECIFAGGSLERYICPECGVIFGPLKFRDQTPDEFNDDYSVHYAAYDEADTTELEIATFMQLNPSKDKVYLNYGCGNWSGAIKRLNAEGYCVFGYEPYAADFSNPYIITNRNEVSKMCFDGIFSNDLLEHLPDPVEELRFMKTLLSEPGAKMAHSTGCYEYMHEYTRFHMFFFTGRSLDVMCEKTGLKHGELIRDDENYRCYVYEQADAGQRAADLLSGGFVRFRGWHINEGAEDTYNRWTAHKTADIYIRAGGGIKLTVLNKIPDNDADPLVLSVCADGEETLCLKCRPDENTFMVSGLAGDAGMHKITLCINKMWNPHECLGVNDNRNLGIKLTGLEITE